jgi:hypothetical protein
MKKHLLSFVCFLFSAGIAFGQSKTPTALKKTVPELNKILAGTGLPVRIVNDSLAVIPYEGENIKSYQVVVQKISDLYIVFCNLSEAIPGKIDETKYKYLLQQNDHYDIVKIGLSADDNMVYLRADLFKAGTNTALIKRIIQQVANVANIIGGDLK